MARMPAGRGRPGRAPAPTPSPRPGRSRRARCARSAPRCAAARPSSHDCRRSKVARKVSASGWPSSWTAYQWWPIGGSCSGPRGNAPTSRSRGSKTSSSGRQVLLAGAAAVQEDDRAGGLARRHPQLFYQLVDVGHEGGRYSVREPVEQQLLVLLLPRPLERFHLEAAGAGAAARPRRRRRRPRARFPVAPHPGHRRGRARGRPGEADAAARHARRRRDLPSRCSSILAGALLARHPYAPSSGTASRSRGATARATRSSHTAAAARAALTFPVTAADLDITTAAAADGRAAGSSTRRRSGRRGLTRRRMSMMLRVIWPTSRSVLGAA